MNRRALLVILLVAALPLPALACTVVTTGVAFGNYSVFTVGHLDSTGTATVNCASPYTLSLSASPNNGGFAPRRLNSLDDSLNYYIYSDATRTSIWGDGSGGTSTVAGAGSGTPVDHTLYGRIPAGQNARVGSYSDTLVLTLEW